MTLNEFKAFVRPGTAVFCVFFGVAYIFTMDLLQAFGHGPGAKELVLGILLVKPFTYILARSNEKKAGVE